MTPGDVAALCVTIVICGTVWRISQLALWLLNGRRS